MFERDLAVGTMSAQLAKLIGLRIVAGDWNPGAALPIESELCRIYGVSRSTVREAMQKLSAKRLVEVAPKLGTRVLPFSDWNLLDPEVLSWRLGVQFDRRIVDDLYEVRNCFEPRACWLAAQGGTTEDHELIARRFAALEASFGTPELAADADVDFHLAIITATHNGLYVAIGMAVRTGLRASFAVMQRRGLLPRHDVSLYRAVLDAIIARDPAGAAAAMTTLLSMTRQRLVDALGQGEQATRLPPG